MTGALQEASLAQAHTQDTGSADYVCWLAQVSNASHVLCPRPQRPTQAAKVHSGTLALHGHFVRYAVFFVVLLLFNVIDLVARSYQRTFASRL